MRHTVTNLCTHTLQGDQGQNPSSVSVPTPPVPHLHLPLIHSQPTIVATAGGGGAHQAAQRPHLCKHLPKLAREAAVAQEGLGHQGVQEGVVGSLCS
jgi:hypothetical protein